MLSREIDKQIPNLFDKICSVPQEQFIHKSDMTTLYNTAARSAGGCHRDYVQKSGQ